MRLSPRPTGQTLLELLATLTLLAVTLAPALRILRDALEQSRRVETLELLTTFCVSKLEEHMALCNASWTAATATGSFSSEGYAQVRFQVVRTDQPASGGIANRLMALTATVWEDQNGNLALDSGEPSVTPASKAAKMQNYPQ